MAERYVISLRYTQRFRIELALEAKQPTYFLGVDAEDVPTEALEMLRAYYAVLTEAGDPHYSPACTVVWDFEPTPEQVLAEVGRGAIACLVGDCSHREDDGTMSYSNFREAVRLFLKGRIAFADLRAASGQRLVDVVTGCAQVMATGLSEAEADEFMAVARENDSSLRLFTRSHKNGGESERN